MDQSGTEISGAGGTGSLTWSISGGVTGSQFVIDTIYNQVDYTATFTGLIDGQGGIAGTWVDTNEQGGTFQARFVTSGIGEDVSNTSLLCNRGPGKTDDFVCTATVVGQNGAPPAPTGTVKFATQAGSFRSGDICSLSPGSGNSASCGVVLMQPVGGFPAGSQVPVVALYNGDNNYDISLSPIATTTITPLPTSPTVCLSDSANNACGGLNIDALEPTITGNSFGTISFGYFAPVGSGAGAPLLPAARVAAPKGAGEIGLEFRYVVRLRDNPSLGSIRELKKFTSQMRNGLIIANVPTKLGFGQRKDIQVNLNAKGKRIVNGLRSALVNDIKLSVVVGVRRKGDRRGTSVTTTTNAAVH